MNRSIRHYLMLGAILTSISSLAQAGPARTAEPGLRITLHVHNYAHVESETLLRAEEETTRIYREIGVDTVWVDQPLLSESQEDPPRDRLSAKARIAGSHRPPLQRKQFDGSLCRHGFYEKLTP